MKAIIYGRMGDGYALIGPLTEEECMNFINKHFADMAHYEVMDIDTPEEAERDWRSAIEMLNQLSEEDHSYEFCDED